MIVLVDHAVGGGVTDAWVGEGSRARDVRDTVATEASTSPFAVFDDIDIHTVAVGLHDALARPCCPQYEGQSDDVAAYLPLVRSRTARLWELAGEPH